jgi:hypothetical protein
MHSKCHARNLHCTASCFKDELSVKAWVSFDVHRHRLLATCSQPTPLLFHYKESAVRRQSRYEKLIADWDDSLCFYMVVGIHLWEPSCKIT